MFFIKTITKSAGAKLFLGGFVLCLSVTLAGDTQSVKKPAKAAPAQGLTVSRDPESGKLQSGALSPAPLPQARLLLGAPPQPVRMPNGLDMLTMTAAQMSTSVVTRNADGSLSQECVDGTAKAEAIVRKAAKKGESKR